MANVTFDGPTKTMTVGSLGSEINVEKDLYSDWKHWVSESDNSKYLQAFRTFGGDPTSTGQYAPKYFFLLNGWTVNIDGNTVASVNVALNLYVDGGGNPFVLINNATVSNLRSDVAVVEVGVVTETNINDIVEGVTGATSADTQTLLLRTEEILGLSQSNYIIENQIYNGDDNLTSATVKTYATVDDLIAGTPILHQYAMVAIYTSGVLTSYQMRKTS